MQLPFLERLAQRLARAQYLLLAHEFIEVARPHAVREGPQRIVGRRVAQQVGLRVARAGAHWTALFRENSRLANSGQRDRPSHPSSRPSNAPTLLAATSRGSPSRPTSM